MAQEQLAAAAEDFGSAFASLVQWLISWWTAGRDPGLALIADATSRMWPVVKWVSAAALAIALVTAGVVLMVRRRGTDLAAAVVGLGRFLLIISAGWLILACAWSLSDAVARWLLGGSVNPEQYREDLTAALSNVEPVLAMTLSVAGIAACLSLIAVIVARFVLAVILTVTVPVLAAFSIAGSLSALRRALSWLVAVIAFRPIAFLVLRSGQQLNNHVRDDLLVLVVAVVTFAAAALVLPLTAHVVTGRDT